MNKQKLQSLMNEARKAKNLRALTTYRTVLSTVQEEEAKRDLSEGQIFKIIELEKKRYLETADVFGDRPEAKGYRVSARILENLLPQELVEDEYEKFVSEAIDYAEAKSLKDMGKVMGEAKRLEKLYKIRVDMGRVSSMVRKVLTQ